MIKAELSETGNEFKKGKINKSKSMLSEKFEKN